MNLVKLEQNNIACHYIKTHKTFNWMLADSKIYTINIRRLYFLNIDFDFNVYLKDISTSLILPSGKVIPMEVSYTIQTITEHFLNIMAHLFWTSEKFDTKTMKNSVGLL